MANAGQLSAELPYLDAAAKTAGHAATDIQTVQHTLRSEVAAMNGLWVGQANVAFTFAHQEWEQAVTRLITALQRLGVNTQAASNDYHATDAQMAASFKGVGGHSSLGGAINPVQ